MERHNHRLILALEQERRTINRDTMNPEISDLSLDDLRPILTMVARVRAAYVKSLMELADCTEGLPNVKQIDKIAELGRSFNELVRAANANRFLLSGLSL